MNKIDIKRINRILNIENELIFIKITDDKYEIKLKDNTYKSISHWNTSVRNLCYALANSDKKYRSYAGVNGYDMQNGLLKKKQKMIQCEVNTKMSLFYD